MRDVGVGRVVELLILQALRLASSAKLLSSGKSGVLKGDFVDCAGVKLLPDFR